MDASRDIIRFSDIQPEDPEWLWYPFIPKGKLTLIQGDPGEGKTTLALTILAAITTGTVLPGNIAPFEPSNVLYQSAEDGLADTIRPRLDAAGADCSKVLCINETEKQLTIADTNRLESFIREYNIKAVVLDPIQAYIGSHVDMNRANEMRPLLRRLSNVAERTKCSIMLIGHLNKIESGKSLYRGLGSIDIAAVCRSILYVGKRKGDPKRRYIIPIKSSLAESGYSLIFEINDSVSFLGFSEVTTDELLNEMDIPSYSYQSTKIELAAEKLEAFLKPGPQPTCELLQFFEQELGICERTVRHAKALLGIKAMRDKDGWYWMLPSNTQGDEA